MGCRALGPAPRGPDTGPAAAGGTVPAMSPMLWSLLVPALVACAAVAVARLLHRFCLRGGPDEATTPIAAVLAGLAVGLAAGPSIAGRLAPEAWERIVQGGGDERIALQRLRSARAADELARTAAGGTVDEETAREERRLRDAAHRTEREHAIAAWRDAVWTHRLPRLVLTGALAATLAIALGRTVTRPRGAPGGLATLNLVLFLVALPGGLGALLLDLRLPAPEGDQAALLEVGARTALLVAVAALVVGAVPHRGGEDRAADAAFLGGGDLLTRAGNLCTVAAALLAAIAFALGVGAAAAPAALPALLLATVRLVPRPSPAPDAAPAREGGGGLVAALLALALLGIDAVAAFDPWLLIGLVLLAGDGRWLAAILALRLPAAPAGRDDDELPDARRDRAGGMLRTMRFAVPAMSAARPMLVLVAPAIVAGWLPGEAALALVAAIAVVDGTTRARHLALAQLEETERELDGDR